MGSKRKRPDKSTELESIDFERVYAAFTDKPLLKRLVICVWKLWYQLRKSFPSRKASADKIPGSKITRSLMLSVVETVSFSRWVTGSTTMPGMNLAGL